MLWYTALSGQDPEYECVLNHKYYFIFNRDDIFSIVIYNLKSHFERCHLLRISANHDINNGI